MERVCFLLFFGLGFISEAQSDTVQKKSLTLEAIQGEWRLDHWIRDGLSPEIDWPVSYHHISIEGNKLYVFRYPMQMYSTVTIAINGDEIEAVKVVKHIKKKSNVRPKSLLPQPESEEVVLDEVAPSSNSTEPSFPKAHVSEETLSEDGQKLFMFGGSFERDSLDVKVIQKLKSGKLNSDCLKRNWQLETHVDSGHDGWGFVEKRLPWKLPKTLAISSKNVHWYWGGDLFYLKINGKLRPFELQMHASDDDFGSFDLVPYKWYLDKEGYSQISIRYSYGDDERYYE